MRREGERVIVIARETRQRVRESYSESKRERERELAKKKKGSHLKRIPEAAV